MSNMINLGINEEMVKPILEKQIQAAIMANIGDPTELIEKTVSMALSQKVNSKGEKDSYSRCNQYDFLEVLTGKYIREAAQESLKEWLEENMQLIREMVIKEMNKPERQESLIKAFADAVEDSLSMSWRFNCDVKFYDMEG